jgi:cbb3-type cytochrome oxidase maturation protein|tara:strand:- start:513 stop:665 length:153 start_codon:yes stop_codon:yes gene_type:complete
MEILAYLIPIALFLGLVFLGIFFYCIKSNQFEDLENEASKILFDDEPLNK